MSTSSFSIHTSSSSFSADTPLSVSVIEPTRGERAQVSPSYCAWRSSHDDDTTLGVSVVEQRRPERGIDSLPPPSRCVLSTETENLHVLDFSSVGGPAVDERELARLWRFPPSTEDGARDILVGRMDWENRTTADLRPGSASSSSLVQISWKDFLTCSQSSKLTEESDSCGVRAVDARTSIFSLSLSLCCSQRPSRSLASRP
mmetsp:Transcript_21463/g.64077  ORF Transcript_21463/g.64077 Transcript_21463/m.64077 type:complete len:202 (+) Transcript_21463:216-821(+)